jgi:hypothetical protein
MSKWRRNNIIERLDHDGWVDVYVPDIKRQEYAGAADGTSEFRQAYAKHAPVHDHSWFNPNQWSANPKPRPRRIPHTKVMLDKFDNDAREVKCPSKET